MLRKYWLEISLIVLVAVETYFLIMILSGPGSQSLPKLALLSARIGPAQYTIGRWAGIVS
jgi:hypothetical protein